LKGQKLLEKEVESYLIKRVKEKQGMCLKWISTVTGVPDRIVLLQNFLQFVELKTQKGVISPRQKIVFSQLEQLGFPVVVIRSKEEVDALLNEIQPT